MLGFSPISDLPISGLPEYKRPPFAVLRSLVWDYFRWPEG